MIQLPTHWSHEPSTALVDATGLILITANFQDAHHELAAATEAAMEMLPLLRRFVDGCYDFDGVPCIDRMTTDQPACGQCDGCVGVALLERIDRRIAESVEAVERARLSEQGARFGMFVKAGEVVLKELASDDARSKVIRLAVEAVRDAVSGR